MQTKASMVMPSYNKAPYLDAMLQSVHDQDYDNIELIFVNDGSTDETAEIITEWKPKLEARGFSVIIINQENMGVGSAVLNGLKQVTGEYVYMPDSDDLLEPNYVSRTAGILDNDSSIDWVWCNAAQSLQLFELTGSDILPLVLLNTYGLWGVWHKAVRKTYMDKCRLIENFVESRFSQEPSIIIPLAIGGSIPYLLHERLYVYTPRENSILDSAIMDFTSLNKYYDAYYKLEMEMLKRYGLDSKRNAKIAKLGIQLHLKGQLNIMINKSIISGGEVFSDSTAHTLAELRSITLSLYCLKKILFKSGMDFDKKFDESFHVKVDPGFDLKFDALLNGSKLVDGRLIVCAALSKAAHRILPLLKRHGVKIDACWDNNASKTSHYGIPLTKPDYTSILDGDLLIIATTDQNIYDDIKSQIKRGQTANANYILRKCVSSQIANEKREAL